MANKRSLYLNPNSWDIGLDNNGNIATTAGLYCDAQNVANATRLFTNDAFLAKGKGIPHFEIELGKKPSLSLVKSIYRKTALSVENIKNAVVNLSIIGKELKGDIVATTANGENVRVEL